MTKSVISDRIFGCPDWDLGSWTGNFGLGLGFGGYFDILGGYFDMKVGYLDMKVGYLDMSGAILTCWEATSTCYRLGLVVMGLDWWL